MFKRPSVLYVLIAIAALAFGLLVYLFDRRPEHVYFLSHGFVLAHAPHSLFGVVGNYLPTFVHVYAFILLTAAVAGATRAIGICVAWFVVASLFELAQLPAVAPVIAASVPAWFARVPVLDNTAAYFLDGTFDVLDLLSIALGTIAAYMTVALPNKTGRATIRSGQGRVWRPVAIGGVATLGLLTIVASGGGGGSGTPDTTPPTVSATYPANGATGFFVDGSIRITFSERMDPGTVNLTTFTLEDSVSHTPVQMTVNYGGDTVTFTPDNPPGLARTRSYTATITTGAKDLAGNALAANQSWSFTTETDAWQATKADGTAAAARSKHSAVWTGSEMIVWGGQDGVGTPLNSGGLYDPGADSWSATATSSAPTPRVEHTAVWTGTKMIVWGGRDGLNYYNTGAAFDPATGWSTVAIPSNFAGRVNHTAVWTGTEMIIWGGRDGLNYYNTGAAFDPATGWSTVATPSNFAGRVNHTAVWTGTEMIIWGGTDGSNFFNNGAAYDPALDSWRPISNPPTGFLGRSNHTAVWTGTEMIVWGGNTNPGPGNDGAAYNPTTNTWRLISTSGAPMPRFNHTAVWTGPTGISMVVWGGQDSGGNPFNTGGRYDPVTDTWKAINLTNVPLGRFDQSAVWTGSQMIVWGGFTTNTGVTNTGGRYTP
jgi:hypothetical protein